MIQRIGISVLITLLVVFGIYKWGYGRGWGDRDAEMQSVIAQKNEEARKTEQKIAELVQAKESELRKANDVIDKKQTDLAAAIRAGRVRLPAPSCVQAPTNSSAADGNRNETSSRPDGQTDQAADDRETLALIAQIAADGDKAINQLNACIDSYQTVMEQINGQR